MCILYTVVLSRLVNISCTRRRKGYTNISINDLKIISEPNQVAECIYARDANPAHDTEKPRRQQHFIAGYVRDCTASGRIGIALDNTCTFHVHATNTIIRLFNGMRAYRANPRTEYAELKIATPRTYLCVPNNTGSIRVCHTQHEIQRA